MFVWQKRAPAKLSDAWEEALGQMDGVTLVITQEAHRPSVLVEAFAERRAVLAGVQRQFGGSVAKVRAQNWAALAPPPSQPIPIRDRLVIISASLRSDIAAAKQRFPGREIIAVPVELAFGTGHHASTATVLRLLCDFARRNSPRPWTALDLGCGSGILGIAAEKLGASSVWGCDFDPLAVKAAGGNLARNGAKRVVFEQADLTAWKPRKRHDCVMANIFADILTDIFPKLARAVKKEGVVIVSGILHTQAGPCLEAGRRAGFAFLRVVRKGKWVTALGALRQGAPFGK